MKRDQFISSAIPVEAALGMLNDAADEISARDEAWIIKRAGELMAEKIADVESFKVFDSDCRSVTCAEQVHRALTNIDAACNGDEISRTAILTSISNVQKIYKAWCEETYRDECMGEAEHELYGEEA